MNLQYQGALFGFLSPFTFNPFKVAPLNKFRYDFINFTIIYNEWAEIILRKGVLDGEIYFSN